MNPERRKSMSVQNIKFILSVNWTELKSFDNTPYKWGDRKGMNVDSNWEKANVIYRWIKNSTGEIAEIGETKRKLADRINNYISAKPNSSAGAILIGYTKPYLQ